MTPELMNAWRRWATAEFEGGEDQADAAFRDVARALPAPALRPDFTSRVMQAVEREALRRARLARLLMVVFGVVSATFAVAVILQIPRLLQMLLDSGVAALLWILVALDRGLDAWAILGQIGRTVAAVIDTPQVTLGLVAFGLIAAAASYGLHRMLEMEEGSSL